MGDHEQRLSQAAQALEHARETRDQDIRAAARQGVSMRRIAVFVGLSHQRVGQIVNEKESNDGT